LNSEAIQLLNFNLPEDIVVYECIAVDPKANAQKDAASRTYSYYFHVEKQVFLNESSFFYTGSPMNFNLLEAGLEFISKQIDFSILCKRPEQYKNADCFITDANLTKLNTFQWVIEITANRFLQGMMRLIVGNLFEIAAEKRELAELKACFSKNTRPEFYTSAYPQGLHLSKVEYPYLTRKNRTQRLN
jgi:tRNA pseudouridine38-40 synthase